MTTTTMTTIRSFPLGAFDAVAQRPEMYIGIDMPFPSRAPLFMLTLTVDDLDYDVDDEYQRAVADADVADLARLVFEPLDDGSARVYAVGSRFELEIFYTEWFYGPIADCELDDDAFAAAVAAMPALLPISRS